MNLNALQPTWVTLQTCHIPLQNAIKRGYATGCKLQKAILHHLLLKTLKLVQVTEFEIVCVFQCGSTYVFSCQYVSTKLLN